MLLKNTSEDFRTFFLVKFTEELISHAKTAETLSIEKRLREKIKENINKIEEEKMIRKIVENKSLLETPKYQQIFKSPPLHRQLNLPSPGKVTGMMRIPIQRLPPTVQHIRPQPVPLEIDLGKLNSLIKDVTVSAVECNGPEKNIIVKRGNETRKTAVTLTKEEINEILQKFSTASKIPISGEIFRVALGTLIMSAIISEVIGTKFIITKMMYGR